MALAALCVAPFSFVKESRRFRSGERRAAGAYRPEVFALQWMSAYVTIQATTLLLAYGVTALVFAAGAFLFVNDECIAFWRWLAEYVVLYLVRVVSLSYQRRLCVVVESSSSSSSPLRSGRRRLCEVVVSSHARAPRTRPQQTARGDGRARRSR